jgi:ribonucleoside-diphosphate reductase alpha chain
MRPVPVSGDPFVADISRHIWDSKYRFRDGEAVHDHSIEDTWRRIARALASVEQHDRSVWEQRFYDALSDFKFLPGGRIQAGAGTGRRVTLFNCFVMGVIDDSMDGIFDGLKEGALTMQQGGGVGYDFSSLRPRGMQAKGVGAVASGPVSFMQIWDSMCATLLSTGARRGAMMATLRCDHPDVETFIEAKQDTRALRHFNLSVLVSDAFMEAVRKNQAWALVFPAETHDAESGEMIMRSWTGQTEPVSCRVFKRVSARALWDKLMRATYEYAEPGVLFIDRINQTNNLWYREHISATNPCGEIPLPPYGACDLGSINLTHFVQQPFSQQTRLDLDGIRATAAIATRMMDNVIDLSQFPLDKQTQQARGSRRIGLGLTGLADCLIMLGLHYAGPEARELAARIMQTICHAAYRASIELAREKDVFPFFDREKYLRSKFIQTLPDDIRSNIAQHGIRNSHLTAIAPTGTISLLANNISSGLEPAYDFCYIRKVLELDESYRDYELSDYAFWLWRQRFGDGELPLTFVSAQALMPETHLDMQAALQPYVDNSISKTINVPQDYAFAEFKGLYEKAYERDLKGCTTFRPNPVTGEVLKATGEGEKAPHCCNVEREAD